MKMTKNKNWITQEGESYMDEVSMFSKGLDKLNNNNHIRDVASGSFYQNFNYCFR